MVAKKRPNYIEKQLKEINEILRSKRLKFENKYDDTLFCWFTNYLLENDWYRGFNMFVDKFGEDGSYLGKVFAGVDYSSKDYYIQIL